jgi:hypothetical protein
LFGLSTDSKAALVALLDQPGRKRGAVTSVPQSKSPPGELVTICVDNPSMELVEGAKVAAEGMEGNSQPSHERISLETKKVVGTALNSVPRQSDKKKY